MDANAFVLLVLLVLGLAFNGRELIKRTFSRVPMPVRRRRWSR